MSFLSNRANREKFRSMFQVMGCRPTKPQDLGIFSTQITVAPSLKKHSKPEDKRTLRASLLRQEKTDNFDITNSRREKDLIQAYNSTSHTRTSPELRAGRKVFLSQPQSASISYQGDRRPCAPPVTPMPEILRRVEYIPSLQDIQAQRSLRGKLQDIEKTKNKQKAKQKEQQAKKEAEKRRDELNKLRLFQRSQIYALNAVMTDLEHQRFQQFQQQMGDGNT